MSDQLPMRDVVKMILQAEGESKSILEKAQAEVECLAANARRQAQDIVQFVRREMTEEAEAIVERAEQEAEQEKQQRLAQAATDIANSVFVEEQTAQSAAEAILRCVYGGQ